MLLTTKTLVYNFLCFTYICVGSNFIELLMKGRAALFYMSLINYFFEEVIFIYQQKIYVKYRPWILYKSSTNQLNNVCLVKQLASWNSTKYFFLKMLVKSNNA